LCCERASSSRFFARAGGLGAFTLDIWQTAVQFTRIAADGHQSKSGIGFSPLVLNLLRVTGMIRAKMTPLRGEKVATPVADDSPDSCHQKVLEFLSKCGQAEKCLKWRQLIA
jgi:hypothetical protein